MLADARAGLFEEVRSTVTVEERDRLAREMHDGVAQELAFVGYQLDDLRIRAALPTLSWLQERGATVTACSHLGRPKDGPDPRFSMKVTADHLGTLINARIGISNADDTWEIALLGKNLTDQIWSPNGTDIPLTDGKFFKLTSPPRTFALQFNVKI